MTNYVNFKLGKDVEKNLGPTDQYNTGHHEVKTYLLSFFIAGIIAR